MDIVCLSSVNWEKSLFQRPQQLMRALARLGHRVLFVSERESLAKNLFERGGKRQAPAPLREVEKRLWVYSPPPEVTFLLKAILNFKWVRRPRSFRDFIRPIREAAVRLGFKKPILWLYYFFPAHYWGDLRKDMEAGLPEFRRTMNAFQVVYDCCDEMSAFEGMPPETAQIEESFVRAADAVFVSSPELEESRQAIREVHLLRNAGEAAFFQGALASEEVLSLGQPVLGYTGALSEWMEWDLLCAVAEKRKEWQIVLVGPSPSEGLQRDLPNVHLLGRRPYEELPSLLSAFSVCILPWKKKRLLKFVDPIKIYEYLAAGKPVVCTAFNELSQFGDLVRKADGPEAFIAAVEEALKETANEQFVRKRRDFAAENTWEGRAREVVLALGERGGLR